MRVDIQKAKNGGMNSIEIILHSGQTMVDIVEDLTLDQIEDLETNLTDIIKQLQDYRLGQNHE